MSASILILSGQQFGGLHLPNSFLLYHQESAPVLSNASIVSSTPSSLADHLLKDGYSSPASLSRVSPSPLILPKASPRARAVAGRRQQKGKIVDDLENKKTPILILLSYVVW